MQEHPQNELDFDDTPQIDTPVIDIQDVEHKPAPATRISNAGVKVRPRDEPHISDDPMTDDSGIGDEHTLSEDPMFAREDEKAREALARFEESLKSLPPD